MHIGESCFDLWVGAKCRIRLQSVLILAIEIQPKNDVDDLRSFLRLYPTGRRVMRTWDGADVRFNRRQETRMEDFWYGQLWIRDSSR